MLRIKNLSALQHDHVMRSTTIRSRIPVPLNVDEKFRNEKKSKFKGDLDLEVTHKISEKHDLVKCYVIPNQPSI